jgi:arylsulfatase A-like enzyme
MALFSAPKMTKAAFLLTLAAPLVVKAVYIDFNIHMFTGTRFFGAAHVFANDAIIYAVILALFYLSFLSKTPRAAAIPIRVLAFLVYALYAIDGVVLVSFNTHLTISDALNYAWYAPQYIAQISRKRDVLLIITAIPVAVLSAWITFTRYTLRDRAQHVAVALSVAGLLLASMFTGNQRYAHAWKYKNVIAYNMEIRSESRGYSDAFVNGPRFESVVTHEPKTAEMPNIILIVVESLSSYQSQYFSGLNDWTPNLDRIASNNTAYTGFYANGFCTNDCYISVLTGEPPIRPPSSSQLNRGGAFQGFEEPAESLPRILSERGYATDFLMSADHAFGGVGPWAERIGFDTIEGHTHPFYDSWDRSHFDAAPDEALYQRVCDRIKEHGDQRFFMYLSTISSHHPFVNPENGHKSEAETIQYADRQLGLFHDRLVEMGFFDNGILIIFGDHHAMVPMKPGEAETFGEYRTAARIPLVVSYGNTKQSVHAGLYQQSDIFNSLKNLTADTRHTSDWAGDIFLGKPAKYAIYRRGDYRDIISIFTEHTYYMVKLDGDNTRVVGDSDVSDEVKRALVGRVNAVRMPRRGE